MLFGKGESARSMPATAGMLLFLGPALGPSVGGALIAAGGWRGIFLINLRLAWPPRSPRAASRPVSHQGQASGTARTCPASCCWLPDCRCSCLASLRLPPTGGERCPAGSAALRRHSTGLLCGLGPHRRPARAEPRSCPQPQRRTRANALRHRIGCNLLRDLPAASIRAVCAGSQRAGGRSRHAAAGHITGLSTTLGQRMLRRVTVRATVMAGFALLTVASLALLMIGAHMPLPVTSAVLAGRWWQSAW